MIGGLTVAGIAGWAWGWLKWGWNLFIGYSDRAGDRAVEIAREDTKREVAGIEGQTGLAKVAAVHDRWWSPRSIMGWCATIYVAKIVVWDTVLGLGVTDDPGSQVKGIVLVIVGFYFGSKAVTDIGATLLALTARRK